MPRGSSEEAGASSSVVAFLIAGVLFMASVVAVLVTTRTSTSDVGVDDASNAAAFGVQADGLADLLLKSPGFVAGSAVDWVDGVPEESRTGKSAEADHVARLGLLDADDPTKLDYAKFQNLRNAPYQEDESASLTDCDGDTVIDDGDCFVNYVEARDALGLDEAGLDFHIRAYPALQSVADILNCRAGDECRDQNLQVTYIGDITPATVPSPPPAIDLSDDLGNPTITCSNGPLPKTYRIALTIRNGGQVGSPAAQLRAAFTVDFAAGPGMVQNFNGPVLAQGDSTTFIMDAPAVDGRTCATGTAITVDIKDVNGYLWEFSKTLTSTTAGATVADKDLWLEAPDYFVAGAGPIEVSYRGNGITNKPAVFEIRDGDLDTYDELVTSRTDHTLRYTASLAKMKNNGGTFSYTPSPALPAGVYTAILYDGSSAANAAAMRVTERIVVVASAPTAPFDIAEVDVAPSAGYGPSGDASDEVAMLEDLVYKFCPTYWRVKDQTAMTSYGADSHAWTAADWDTRCPFKASAGWQGLSAVGDEQMGDVFPANDKVLRDGLICRLTDNCGKSGKPIYDYVDVLIVGSGVEHRELSSENIKGPIETWVEGGGTLIVLGSEVGKNNNWLSPFLNSGTRSSGGGVSVPDPAHPVLHVPDELDYSNYENGGEVWDFRGSSDANDRFTQVVSQGEDGEFEPILAVSKPGALRDDDAGTSGTVILTTWVAYDVYLGAASPQAAYMEGLKFFNNLLMMGYGDLYLDYGPDIPDNTNVVPSVRVARIQHPDFAEPIEVRLNVFVFG